MDVQDQLVKCTFSDLDDAPKAGTGKKDPDEFDVNPYKVGVRFLMHSPFFTMTLLPILKY